MKTNILEANQSADWQSGYDAAIEAIRQKMQGSGGQGDGLSNDDLGNLPGDPNNQQGGQNGQQGQEGQGGQQGSGSRGSGNQGVVRPEDCIGPGTLDSIPDTPGGFMDKKYGDKLAESEGYEKEGGNDSAIEKDWEDRAIQAAKQYSKSGKGGSKFAAKIFNIYKSKADWKKELRKVVGRSISEEDKRRGYTSNNILVSQDRIALTDKQKFDNLDYILVCLDTSGSFFGDKEYIKQSLTEVANIALAKKPLRIFIVYWDTQIADIDMFTSAQDLIKSLKAGKVTAKGGGGTDPSCIWHMLKTDKRFRRMRPELTIIFTDGYFGATPKRDSRRMQNLVWCVIDNPSFEAPADQFTRTIHIKLNG